jgi:glycosyltransferase involved in cell wall biosynthesis
MICSVEGEAAELVARAGAGLCIEPEDADALAAAIEKLRSDPDLRTRMSENGRRFVTVNYLRSALAEEYADALAAVVRGNRCARVPAGKPSPQAPAREDAGAPN